MSKPQSGKNANAPGSYGIAVRLDKYLVDPGERLRIEIYISGYGKISGCKLVTYPSPAAFDELHSWVRFGVRNIDGKTFFGGKEQLLDPSGNTIDIGSGGMKRDDWLEQTMFFDTRESGTTPQIFTETRQKPKNDVSDGPITLNLKLNSKARAGTHSVQFVLTYFNGSCWATSTETVSFTVRTFYQRNELKIWLIGALIAVAGVILSGIACYNSIFSQS